MLVSTNTDGLWEALQWLAVPTIIYFCVLYMRRRNLVNLVDKIPGPKSFPVIGSVTHWRLFYSTLSKQEFLMQYFQGLSELFCKDKITRVWFGPVPLVVLFHPDVIEVLLSSNVLIDKGFGYTFFEPWIGKGLITSTGEKWKNRRKQLAPAFHIRILKTFLSNLNGHTEILIKKIDKLSEKDWIDVLPLLTQCTLDMIAETALGVSINSQEDSDSQYLQAISAVLKDSFMGRVTRPWLWPDFIYKRSEIGKTTKKSVSTLHDFTIKVIREKKAEYLSKMHVNGTKSKSDDDRDVVGAKKRMAFLDLLMELHLDGNQITEEEMEEEINTFIFAGYDTTAHSLMWSLYFIGRHPHVQKKIQEELDGILGEDSTKPFTMEDLREMKYIECTIKESLRIIPVVPLVGRKLSEDLVIKDYVIPEGVTCAIPQYCVHRNPDFFPNPESFDPDRFLPENSRARHPYAYIPFSAGPRNCIGQKYAIMEEKVVFGSLLRNFQIRSLDPFDKIHVIQDVLLNSEPSLRIHFKRR